VSPVDLMPSGEIALYEAPDGQVRLDVRLERETIWLSQMQMAELFDTSTDNVGLHLKNVYAEGELGEQATTEEYSVVQSEGTRQVRRKLRHYMSEVLTLEPRFVSKAANVPGLQIADLVARPIGRHALDPRQPNRAFEIIEKKLDRNPSGRVSGWGLKVFPA